MTGIIVPHLEHTATEDNIAQGKYALDIMRRVMPLYEKVFDLEYPLPKLDILVVRWVSKFNDDLPVDAFLSPATLISVGLALHRVFTHLTMAMTYRRNGELGQSKISSI